MREKLDSEWNGAEELQRALANPDSWEMVKQVTSLIQNGVKLTPSLLEQVLATYNFRIIDLALEHAVQNGLKTTTECLNIMIEHRAAATAKLLQWAQVMDPTYGIYRLQARSVKLLIATGAEVTEEILSKSIKDEAILGEHVIQFALKDTELQPTSTILQQELTRIENRLSAIKGTARVLGQALRNGTSLFSTLPDVMLAKITALTENDQEDTEENQSDFNLAMNHLGKP